MKRLDLVLFVCLYMDDNKKLEPLSSSFTFSKNEATVYGKHGCRRGLAFSMVVVHSAMAMGSVFV